MSDSETDYAQGRRSDRTYVSRTFKLDRPGSADDGEPARFIYKVFDEESGAEIEQGVGDYWTVRTTPGGRRQVKLLGVGEPGRVKELWVQNVPGEGSSGRISQILNLNEEQSRRFIDLVKALDSIPVDGGETVRLDDELIAELFTDPDAPRRLYSHKPEAFARLIEGDEHATDVVAVAGRRRAVEEFRRMMADGSHFDRLVNAHPKKSQEGVWQRFFEQHPWMLGANLGFQLLTSWSNEKLEQVVVGASIDSHGKRVDGLLRTSGRVKSLVFAEIKTHRTHLLSETKPYRSGCWAPSSEVVGGVAQSQGTVHLAVSEIGSRLQETDEAGADIPGEFTYLLRPRSYLVVGDLAQLQGEAGGDHRDKVRSFELYRRELLEPDVVTFDEVLARAEWIVDIADEEARSGEVDR